MKDQNQPNSPWSRRRFSKAILSLQVLVASGALTVPLACIPEDSNALPLGKKKERVLIAAMDELIPASQEMPSASDAGGLQYIYSVLEEQAQLTGPFVQMIDQLIDYSRSTTDVYFDKLDDQTRIKILRQFEADFPEVFQVLFNFVYESYYINERIWQLIGYEPHPTMSMGATMEPFDEELLVQVRNRPPFFIDIKT